MALEPWEVLINKPATADGPITLKLQNTAGMSFRHRPVDGQYIQGLKMPFEEIEISMQKSRTTISWNATDIHVRTISWKLRALKWFRGIENTTDLTFDFAKYGWPAHLRAPIRTSRAFKVPRLRNLELRNCLIDRPLMHFLWINRDSLRRITFTDCAVRYDPSPQDFPWLRVFKLFERRMPLLKEVNMRTTKEDSGTSFT